MVGAPSQRDREAMPDLSVAETLPRVYRRVLDAVERLEQLGGRQEAARFRAAAIRVYSGSWDASSHRHLEDVALRAEIRGPGARTPRAAPRRLTRVSIPTSVLASRGAARGFRLPPPRALAERSPPPDVRRRYPSPDVRP